MERKDILRGPRCFEHRERQRHPSGVPRPRQEASSRHCGRARDSLVPRIGEAYGVLSDPQHRREYDQQLSSAEARGVVAVRRPPPPPLVSRAVPIFANRDGTRRSSVACERFRQNFTGMGIPNSAWPTGLDFEVLLTPEEASRGCVVPLGIPAFSRCPQCGGSGLGYSRARTVSSRECSSTNSCYASRSLRWHCRD